jgi:hypothetical protein
VRSTGNWQLFSFANCQLPTAFLYWLLATGNFFLLPTANCISLLATGNWQLFSSANCQLLNAFSLLATGNWQLLWQYN